jgi:hypothetical protein
MSGWATTAHVFQQVANNLSGKSDYFSCQAVRQPVPEWPHSGREETDGEYGTVYGYYVHIGHTHLYLPDFRI